MPLRGPASITSVIVDKRMRFLRIAGWLEQRFEFAWRSARHVLSASASTDAPAVRSELAGDQSAAAPDSAGAFREMEAFLDEQTKT
jgi:hypothetical protein